MIDNKYISVGCGVESCGFRLKVQGVGTKSWFQDTGEKRLLSPTI